MYLNMNGYLVIIAFTVILAVTLVWLQGRQLKKDASEPKKVPTKKIEVIKARDWPVQDEDESEKEKEPEPVAEESEESGIEETEPEVEPIIKEEPVTEEEIPEPVEETDIAYLSGVGPKYRSLLRTAGITTINQIAASEPEALLKMLHETNEETGITKRPPTMKNVESWIEAAKAQLL